MPNPALEKALRLVFAGFLVSSCAPVQAATQDQVSDQGTATQDQVPDQGRVSQIDWRENFYGIRAEGSHGTRLEIRFEPGLAVRASAVLMQQTSTWTATTSECPRFTAALEAFRRLPPLKPGPAALQPNLSGAMTIPPRPTGGESWIIRTSAYAPDWSSNEIVMRGLGGPYPFWVGDTVEVIKACSAAAS